VDDPIVVVVVDVVVEVVGATLVEVVVVVDVTVVVGARLVLVVDVGGAVEVVVTVVELVLVDVPEVEVELVEVVVMVVVDVMVVVVVTVLLVVTVVETPIVVVVVGAGQASPTGRGSQMKVNLSLSVFLVAFRRSVPLPGLFNCFPFTGTGKSTKALHAELRSLGRLEARSSLPAFDLALALTLLGSRVAGSQPATPELFTHAAMLNVHEPFGVSTPSRSQAGSQSVQTTPNFVCFLLIGERSACEYPSSPM
jgi:hypothetical protein